MIGTQDGCIEHSTTGQRVLILLIFISPRIGCGTTKTVYELNMNNELNVNELKYTLYSDTVPACIVINMSNYSSNLL